MNFHAALISLACLAYSVYLLNFGYAYIIPLPEAVVRDLNHMHIEHSEISRSNARLSGRILSAALCMTILVPLPSLYSH